MGLAAAQLAKVVWEGVQVIVTAGSDEKLSVCKKNGADFGINYKTEDFAVQVMNITKNKGTCTLWHGIITNLCWYSVDHRK